MTDPAHAAPEPARHIPQMHHEKGFVRDPHALLPEGSRIGEHHFELQTIFRRHGYISRHLHLFTAKSIRRGVPLHGREGGPPNIDISELSACGLRVRAVVQSERQAYQQNSRATSLHDASNGNPCAVLEWPEIDVLGVTFVRLRASPFAFGMAIEGS